jgi:hypothetical protein
LARNEVCKGMKNTRLPRLIALVAFVSLSVLTTSCGNLFWKAEQTVLPGKRAPLAFSEDVPNRVASGNATTTLHNAGGDTIAHRWENGKLKFFKSENPLYLVARDAEGDVLSCTAFYFYQRTFIRKKGSVPFRKLPLRERYAFQSWGSVGGLVAASVSNIVNPYDSFTPILFILTGETVDLGTYAVGAVKAQKDPRRALGLIRVRRLMEDDYPDFLASPSMPRNTN